MGPIIPPSIPMVIYAIPVGYLIYLLANIAGVRSQPVIREPLPFLLLLLLAITYVPILTLGLPAWVFD